jgi:hypothetical protein
MAGCTIEEEYLIDEFCDVSSAGVFGLEVIAHKRNEETFSDSIAVDEDGLVNGVLTGSDAATPANWKKIDQDIEIADATQNTEGSRENGTVVYPIALNVTFHYGKDPVRNAKLRKFADELCRKNTVVRLTMQNGSKRLYGRTNGLRGTSGDDTTGKAMGDLNGVMVSLTGKEPERWNPIRMNEGTPASIAAGYEAMV